MPVYANGFQVPLSGYTLTQDHNDYYYNASLGINGYHLGEDWWNGSSGGTVSAIGNGIVIWAGYASGYGSNFVAIEHTLADGTTVTSYYGHMESENVTVGQTVSIGQTIGTVGNEGLGTGGAHLHFAIFVGSGAPQIPAGYSSAPDPDIHDRFVDPSWFINTHPPLASDPDLIADSFTVSATSVEAGGALDFSWEVANIGSGDQQTLGYSGVYISTDSTITTSDTLLHDETFSTLTAGNRDTNEGQDGVLIPSNLAPGTYWVGVIADNRGTVFESNGANNVSNVVQITITAPASDPDLIADSFTVSATSVEAGGALDFSWEVANIGSGDQQTLGYSGVYISTDSTITTSDTLLHDETFSTLTAGNRDTNEGQDGVLIPSNLAPGTYWVGVIADNRGTVFESNGANNVSNVVQITITAAPVGVYNGTLGNDVWHGGSENNDAHGLDGDDALYGGRGQDLLYGGADNDRLYGGSDDDQLRGGSGDDRLNGGNGDDSLYGNADNDRLFGDDGNDRLYGGDGLDNMHGGVGADRMYGDADNDRMYGDNGSDNMHGGTGNDRMYGNSGNDRMYGDVGSDQIYGGAGNDRIYGGNGSDRIYGSIGDDTIAGGWGNDTMEGGAGSDTFVFGSNAGADTITDFDTSVDTIRFNGTGLNFAALNISYAGGNATIDYGTGTIVLEGVASGLNSGDFDFV